MTWTTLAGVFDGYFPPASWDFLGLGCACIPPGVDEFNTAFIAFIYNKFIYLYKFFNVTK